jgi:DNA-binding SARP family transcriptional activator
MPETVYKGANVGPAAQVKVLGPVEVTMDDSPIRLAGERQRALVALLAIESGWTVSVTRILDVLWDGRPPMTARTKLQAHVSAVRHAMGRQGSCLLTRPNGYALRRDSVELDLEAFDLMAARAREALYAGELPGASELFRRALLVWRGPALADIELRYLRYAADALDERRLLAVEAKAEVDLALGRDETVVAELPMWVVARPLRERLRVLLMMALYRRGCRADALRVYSAGREIIVEELGLEPGTELRALHQRILADDPALKAGPPVLAAMVRR